MQLSAGSFASSLVVVKGLLESPGILANHKEDFEKRYEAEFTENFKKHTSSIQKAEIRTFAAENKDNLDVEVRLEAGKASQDEIEHALATGKNHVRHGNQVYLLTKELKEKTGKLQKRISGDPNAPLLARTIHPIENTKLPQWKNFCLKPIPDSSFQPNGKCVVLPCEI